MAQGKLPYGDASQASLQPREACIPRTGTYEKECHRVRCVGVVTFADRQATSKPPEVSRQTIRVATRGGELACRVSHQEGRGGLQTYATLFGATAEWP